MMQKVKHMEIAYCLFDIVVASDYVGMYYYYSITEATIEIRSQRILATWRIYSNPKDPSPGGRIKATRYSRSKRVIPWSSQAIEYSTMWFRCKAAGLSLSQ